MSKRKIGPFTVEPVGLGCMSLSHAYGIPPAREDAARLLHQALDAGYDFLDTAALYGFGANETLIGETLQSRRHEFILASKCGMTAVDGKRVLDGRPETLLRTINDSLRRLRTDVIDLYYLHRRDFSVPIEDSVGALAQMVQAGKVRAIGLSEISAATFARAHATHPIAAVQSEYSPWSREIEIGVLAATVAAGTALVAFSPVARGFLAGGVPSRAVLPPGDFRATMPRFQPDAFEQNLAVLSQFTALATEAGMTPAQLSLAWVLGKSPHIIAIPGTTSPTHLVENFAARDIVLTPDLRAAVEAVVNRTTIAGERYPPQVQREIDTEQFAA